MAIINLSESAASIILKAVDGVKVETFIWGKHMWHLVNSITVCYVISDKDQMYWNVRRPKVTQ